MLHHTPRKRGIQYSEEFIVELRLRGILDRPPSRTMTAFRPNLLALPDDFRARQPDLTLIGNENPPVLARGADRLPATTCAGRVAARLLRWASILAGRPDLAGLDDRERR